MLRLQRRSLGKFAVLMALSLGAVWSCSNSDKERIQAAGLAEGCTLNSDCLNPLVCTFTRCHDECKSDRDCPGEQRCVKGDDGYICQLKLETDCTRKPTACQGEQVCGIDGECRDSCSSNTDCTKGQTCATSGECASTVSTKDIVDEEGNILVDTFVDPDDGAGNSGGSGGSAGTTSNGGATGKAGEANSAGSGGLQSSSGAGGVAGSATTGTAGANVSSGGATLASGGSAVAAAGNGQSLGGANAAGATAAGGTSASGGSGNMGYAGYAGMLVCNPGWGNCDTNPTDCETNLALITSCGACSVACDPAHGSVKCDAASLTCVINVEAGGCSTGYADCNKTGTDGCEANLASDANNCGACGRSCGGGKCTSSQCGAAVAFDPTGASTLSYSYTGSAFLSGNQLVKLNTDNGTEIRTSALPPTTPVSQGTVLATSTTAIYAMDVDAANVYYAIAGSPASILYKPLNGGLSSAAKIAVNMPDSNYAQIITSNATAFYMTAYSSGTYQILTAAKTLTTASTAGPLSGMTGRAAMSSLVVAGTSVFWIESPNIVFVAPLGGGTPVALDSTSQSGYYSYLRLVSDGTYVYWNTYNGASSRIRRVLAAGSPTSTSVTDVAIGVNSPGAGLAVDDAHIYFYYSQQVYRAAKDGSTSVEPLANLNSTPYFYNLFAVDSGFVYGTGSAGQIVRVSKALAAK